MNSYKYILQKKSPLCKALQCLLQMFSVPSDHIIAEGEHFAVKAGSKIHIGVLPVLSTLRSTTTDAALQAFVGTDAEVYPLVNQWVSTAVLLSVDATCDRSGVSTPITKHIFAEIEKSVESFDLKKSFLVGTPRATVADFLLYAAIHGHPDAMKEAQPSTMAWSLHAQNDPYLKPILSEAAIAEAEAKLANAQKSKKPVFVKPSEEEILRRRLEKEKEKQEKLAKAAAAGGAATSSSSDAKEAKAQQSKQKEPASLDPNTLDIRVGRFTNLKRHPDADRLYVEEMDLGSEKRTIVSGLVEHYKPEELEGTLCLAVCNMKPKPLKGVTSHGMVLCASNEKTLRLVRPPEGAQPGDRILFADVFDAERLKETKQLSGNAMSELIGFLRTDSEGVVRWRDIPALHAAGMLKVPEVTDAVVK
ncbi:putative tyrosyl-tRNA synthetase [Trypanosoma theileri]|uniref:Putative tyrosyl-tRNA synthetase n=1 Tax=Trypanosoma theileri TaxID=67003 RepID=A0A1X0NUW2_9TRYP|nr:putative tyrosyl-tRNA synthetase [Trypanosoma theileri]ORC87900.1 putative tyrosyl-tRNA synthetase [Trypanosoma theileri]